MSDPVAALRKGLVDRYAFERELGRGGMATVYLARDLRHDRPVALKLLHPELAASMGDDRFQREIKLAARLQHPHILTVYDSGETDGRLWFTMPYVEGESLRGRLARERQLPLEDALRVAREAAQALQYAHDHGVVHRDIKPENLMLTRDGNTLVADFGIARALSGGAESRLTETGLAVGTPAYMSPEQASGDRGIDARTDVYSLGAVLYEMLAGEPPYTGATVQAILAKRFTEPPPSLRAARSSVPDSVDQAIRKALAPVPADRFSTVAQFAQALQGTSSTTSPTAPTVVTAPPATPAPAEPPRAVPAPRKRRVPLAASALVLGILIGLGVLFAWRRSNHAGDGSDGGSRVLAVLPFENLGDSADAYFADGVTDEVRTKLAQVTGLEVIARGSSNEYRATTKRAQEIAQELGASYLLTGTVRWTKATGGTSRVRVSPELVEVRPGQSPRSRWGEQFDAGLTDVFEVQGEIAGKVVDALGVALADSVREELALRPTENLAAYDHYLKGEVGFLNGGVGPLRLAIASYQEAVRLDSTFLPAWARLGRAASIRYINSAATKEVAELAETAVRHAQRVAPRHPETLIALGSYQAFVLGDPAKALGTFEAGLRLSPNNADLVAAAAQQEQTLGRWEAALARSERAAALDPRSILAARRHAYALLVLGRYEVADAALDRALILAPGSLVLLHTRVMAALGRGDVEAVRRMVRSPQGVGRDTLIAYLAQYEELGWALEPSDRDRLFELPLQLFDDDAAARFMVYAHMSHLRGDRDRTRLWADSTRLAFVEQLRAAPEDAQRLTLYGVALAYLGRKQEAIREGERGVRLLPMSRDAFFGPYLQHQLVRIYLLVGEPERALDALEPLGEFRYTLSPAWMRIDPMFDPLRKHPRFQKLVGGSP
jgi:serine/threonine protein kinase/Flp pilus assembly protein TadD